MKYLLCGLLVWTATLKAYSQNPSFNKCTTNLTGKGANTFLYTYDYSKLTPYLDCHFKPKHKKDKIYVLVNNINRLALDIQASSESYSIALQKINLFDSLAEKLNTSSISKDTNAVNGVPEETRTIRSKKNPAKFIVIPNNDPYLSQKHQIAILQASINSDYIQLISDLKQLDYFSKFAKNVSLLIGSECCSQSNLKTSILNEPNLSLFYPGVSDFASLKSIINTTPISTVIDLKSKEEVIKKARQQAGNLLAEIKKNCKVNKTQDQDICDLDNLENNFPNDLEEALRQANKITITNVTDVVTELISLLSKVENAQNFRYLSRELLAEGDNLRIKIGIKPKSEFSTRFNADTIDITAPVKGKFEWAIGPALNFHVSKSLFNFSYQVDSAYSNGKAKSDTFLIKKNKVRNQFIPSIGVMAHFYWQNHSSLTPGVTVGLSTSPANLSDLKAYLGGSLLIGGINDKLIFSAGFAGGSVDRLNANLIEGENPKTQIPFTGEKIGSPEELVEKTFKIGFYFGFTYKINN